MLSFRLGKNRAKKHSFEPKLIVVLGEGRIMLTHTPSDEPVVYAMTVCLASAPIPSQMSDELKTVYDAAAELESSMIMRFGRGAKGFQKRVLEMIQANEFTYYCVDKAKIGGVIEKIDLQIPDSSKPRSWRDTRKIAKWEYVPPKVNHKNSTNVAAVAEHLPGVAEKVPMPCGCTYRTDKFGQAIDIRNMTLYYGVIHLNDEHKWSRNKIADWIDELHDDGLINAEFAPWQTEMENNNGNNS